MQAPIPVVVGGRTAPAYRRAVSRGHGWFGFGMTPEHVATSLEGLAEAAKRVERPAALGPLEITVTPRGRLTPESVAAFADLGVHRLVPVPPPTPEGAAATIEAAAAAVA